MNLDPQQVRQAEAQRQEAEKTVEVRLPEAYSWLLVPVQQDAQGRPDPAAAVTFEAIRLQGADPLAVRASKRLRNDELLLTSLAGTRLRMELDRIPLWRGDHVQVRQLVEDFARYVYLPRLKEPAVLVRGARWGEPAELGTGWLCLRRQLRRGHGAVSGLTLRAEPLPVGLGPARAPRQT